MNDKINPVFRQAFQKTIPVMMGYVPIGIAFGFLLAKSGFYWLYAPFMSVAIYSGATQFLAIGFFINNAPLIEVAVATLLLNLRHCFFGLSLIRKFTGIPFVKPYLIFALTDETYALLTSMEQPDEHSKQRFYFYISLLNHLYWITGSFVGALLGHLITINIKGLEFALTALFVVLTVEQHGQVKSLKPFGIALAAGIFSLVLVAPQYMLLTSILIGTGLLILFRDKQ